MSIACLVVFGPMQAATAANLADVIGSDARYYSCEVTSISPQMPGVTITVTAQGDWVRVTNTSPTELVVHGYSDEPYARIGPQGVEENINSMSTLLNGSMVVPSIPKAGEGVQPAAGSEHWVSRGVAPTFVWHDHRMHWMSANLPPRVAADPSLPQVITTWQVNLSYGSNPVTVTGRLNWLGRPGIFSGASTQALWLIGAVSGVGVLGWVVRLVVLDVRGRRLAA